VYSEPRSRAEKLSKSIEMMLKTVLAGAGYASRQLEVLLGRRLLARGQQSSTFSEETPTNPPVTASTRTVATSRSAEPENHNVPSVLLIEPDPIARKAMRMALQCAQCRVVEAGDGQTALKILAKELPHLVVQNLRLPDMDGCGLVQWLGALPNGRNVPIMAFAQDDALLTRARKAQAGFTGYLIKPFMPSHLLQTIFFYTTSQFAGLAYPEHFLPKESASGVSGDSVQSLSLIRGRRILVAEEYRTETPSLTQILKERILDVNGVTNGEDLLVQARGWRPDAVVCDILLPSRDGYELCLAIREEDGLAHLPVVLMSSGPIAKVDRDLAQNVGANAVIPRSSDFREVIGSLATCLQESAVVNSRW